MRIVYKILWIIACIGVLAVSSYLFYPRPAQRPILPGGHDPDQLRQGIVDGISKETSEWNAKQKILQDFQDRKSSHAVAPEVPGARPEATNSGRADSKESRSSTAVPGKQ